MAAKVVALYRKPADPAAFDQYYYETHVPIAAKMPGLRGAEASVGGVNLLDGESPYHHAGVLSFESMEALQAALASPEGQAAAADLAKFATGGVDVFFFETKRL
ncbi:MAG TPA: EthD family reductase [Thermoanaerobaculia bacterium]|nr:EthD family reductase [Thermoanaerobaculia bacterium]